MNIPPKYLKLTPLLMVAAMIVFLVGDQAQFKSQGHQGHSSDSAPVPDGIGGEPMHAHEEEAMDHSDPEAQRRMGIFHYNEGNKLFQQGDWEQAVRNYRMALHHNEKFEEAYINLSTAYLKGKQFKETLDTLDRLEKINPSHPLLHYNLACYHALTGQIDSSLEALNRAVDSGFRDFRSLENDPDLENLRRDPRYQEWRKTVVTGKS